MSFAKQLEESQLQAWKDYYLPYCELTEWLAEVAATPSACRAAPLNFRYLLKGETINDKATVEEIWRIIVERSAVRVGKFIDVVLESIDKQLNELANMGQAMSSGTSAVEKDSELRFLEALGRVKECLSHLRGFVEINHAALFKIMKKHDKKLRTDQGIWLHFPRLVGLAKLGDLARFHTFDAELQRMSCLTVECKGLDASLEVATFAAGLSRHQHQPLFKTVSRDRQGDQWLFFFMGTSSSLTCAISVAMILPPLDPDTFHLIYFLAPFPVFQVVLSIVVTLWGCGFVARTCESHNVSHLLVLGADPRCRVDSRYLFARAAALSTCWVLIFGMYTVDYKWKIIQTAVEEGDYNERASWHYVFYPALLILITIIGIMAPSSLCSCSYKLAFLRSVGRTALAPFFAVSFADNIVGDAMTSLAKPLETIPSAWCYFFSRHPQTRESMELFRKHGDLCTCWEHHAMRPLIVALPFFFRAMQCLRNFRDTRDSKHLCNLGKYTASLLVVVVSSVYYVSSYFFIGVSVLATIYAATWDLTMDWGLTLKLVLPNRSPWAANATEYHKVTGTQSAAPPDMSDGAKPSQSDTSKERSFSQRWFLIAALLDIVMRFTWLQSLMPATILTDDIKVREVILVITIAVEITRRSLWAILRIENEQVVNAGKFQTLLWTPTQLHTGAAEEMPSCGSGRLL